MDGGLVPEKILVPLIISIPGILHTDLSHRVIIYRGLRIEHRRSHPKRRAVLPSHRVVAWRNHRIPARWNCIRKSCRHPLSRRRSPGKPDRPRYHQYDRSGVAGVILWAGWIGRTRCSYEHWQGPAYQTKREWHWRRDVSRGCVLGYRDSGTDRDEKCLKWPKK